LFSWRLVAFSIVLFTLGLLLADGLWAAFRLNEDLETVSANLGQLNEELGSGDLDTARTGAEDALAASRSAVDAGRRPSFALVSLLPGAKEDLGTIVDMAFASEKVSQAATLAVQAAESLGLDEEGTPRLLYSEGQVNLDTATKVRDALNGAERSLTEAQIGLEGLSPRLAMLQAPLDRARGQVAGALTRATNARTLFDLLHPLLGGDDSRKYLLALQAPGEARGTGGLVGVAGVLSAEDGRLKLGRIRSYSDIVQGPILEVDAPAWFEQSYGAQRALTQWPQANVSPNFPVVSQVYLEMYEQETGHRLDGVFAMDPIALSQLMVAVEPIETSQPDIRVDATNVVETLLVDSYTRFEDSAEQDVFLEEVVRGFWDQLEAGDLDTEAFADGLAEAIRTQHLKVYSAQRPEQDNIIALGVDGGYDSREPAQMAFNVNYAANKVDYFLYRDIETDIELSADGTAHVDTTLVLDNRSPEGEPSLLLGGQADLLPGVNRMTINLLMPPNSALTGFAVGGEAREPLTYVDDNSPVVWDILELDPGATETVEISYSIPGALLLFERGTVFDLVLFPQTTVNPDSYTVRVTPPPGNRIVEGPGDITPEGVLELSGTLDAPVPVRVQLEPR
jgi:hypothetical protein